MENTRIQVKTMGYYHRDKDMKVTLDLLPKRLNQNKIYIDYKQEPIPFENLNIEVKDSGAGEHKMESLLEYIKQRPWKSNEQPDFVTNRNLLKFIASGDYYDIEVQVARVSGVIFMIKTTVERDMIPNFGAVFEHFLTGNSMKNEEIGEDGTVRKAVFIADIPTSSEKKSAKFKVLYSGEIDAIDDDNQHLKLRVQNHGMNFVFWTKPSCIVYWQAIFSNIRTIIIGSRTGNEKDPFCKPPKDYPQYSVYQIRSLQTLDIPSELEIATNDEKNLLYKNVSPSHRIPQWTVQNSEKNIQEFLTMVQKNVKEDGEFVTFTKVGEGEDWIIKKGDEKVLPFFELVKECMNNFKTSENIDSSIKIQNHLEQKGCDSEIQLKNMLTPTSENRLNLVNNIKMNEIIQPVAGSFETDENVFQDTVGRKKSQFPPKNNSSREENNVVPNETSCTNLTFEQSNSLKTTSSTEPVRNKNMEDILTKSRTHHVSVIEENPALVPGLLQMQPKSKIVFNAPYDEILTNRMKITNQSAHRIVFNVKTKSKKISIQFSSRLLNPQETITLKVECNPFDVEKEQIDMDRIIIEWTNSIDEKEGKSPKDLLEEDGIFRRKTIMIEYNE